MNSRIQLERDNEAKLVSASLLPCHIGYSGPADSAKYFRPETSTPAGGSEAYFRGRQLLGKELPIPDGHVGLLYDSSRPGQTKPTNAESTEDTEDETIEEVRLFVEKARFDRLTVYENGRLPIDTSDPYMKGLQEWLALAEAVSNTLLAEC